MPLVHSANDNDHLADFGVSSHTVLTSDSLLTGRPYHKLFSEQSNVLAFHDKKAVRLNEVFVPEEKEVFEGVLDGSVEAFVGA